MTPDALNAVFFALASEPRRRVLDVLKAEPGCNLVRVCEFLPEMGRFAVMKHLGVLERAGLVISQRQGRERRLWFDATPIQLVYERWTTEFSAYWAARLTRLKYSAEGAEVTPIQRQKRTTRHG